MPKRIKSLVFSVTLLAPLIYLATSFTTHLITDQKINKLANASNSKESKLEGILDERYAAKIWSVPFDKSLKFTSAGYDTSGDIPYLHGKYAATIEMGGNKVLFAKESTKKVPIASLTKIMTAIVALEHKRLDEKMTVSEKAANIGENAMGISEGEVYPFEDLLYGLILNSGNDAAVAIAENTAGSEKNFVYWMNLKAGELGLNQTVYADASGLNPGNQSSAEDLAKLTEYALKNDDFRKVAASLEYETYGSEEHKYIYLSNQTNLLRTYPGVKGVKTGYTEEAGLCLVTYAENNGKRIIGVVLNSDDRKGDMIQMLDYSFGKLGIYIDHPLLNFESTNNTTSATL